MCVVAVARNAHPRWHLVAVGNRDELHARDALALNCWHDDTSIIAGRDLLSKGTWMGVSRAGRFAVLTNVRNLQTPEHDKTSRGMLVPDFLARGDLPNHAASFNPFNLLVADRRSFRVLSNRPLILNEALGDGIFGLSNGSPDEKCPRKARLHQALSTWLAGPAEDPADMFAFLSQENSDSGTSPIFIRNLVYGTRCSTVLAVDEMGCGIITERRFNSAGICSGESSLRFVWTD